MSDCREKLAYHKNCAAKKCLQREQGKSNNIEYLKKHKKSLSVLCAGLNTCTPIIIVKIGRLRIEKVTNSLTPTMSFEEKRLIAGRSPLHSSTTIFCNLETWVNNLSKIKRSAD